MKRLLKTFLVVLCIFGCKSVPSNLESNKDLDVWNFCAEKDKLLKSSCFQNYLNNYLKNNFYREFTGEPEESLIIGFKIDEKGYIHSISARPKYKNWNTPHPKSLIEAERILKVLSRQIRINFAVFSDKELEQYLKSLSDESIINGGLAPFEGGYEIPLTLNFEVKDRFINYCERFVSFIPPPPPDPPIEENILRDSPKTVKLEKVDIYFGDNFLQSDLDIYPVTYVTFVCDTIPIRPYTEYTRRCFNEFIASYIDSHLNLELINNSGLTGRHISYINFFIDKNGKIGDVCARPQNSILSNELIRILKSLPNMAKPGRINGRDVGAKFFKPFLIDFED